MTDYFLKALCALQADRRGVTAMEYAVIAGVLVAVIVTAFTALGTDITAAIAKVTTAVNG